MNRDKVAFITGGSRGIGQSLVQQFKAKGWKVATCSTRLANLRESNADFKFACDVSRPDEVKTGVTQILQSLGTIDVLINNAGISGSNSFSPDESDDFWHRIIDVNLHGTYYACKYVTPHLPDETGRIINIASVLALKGVPDATAYCAAKHGVLGLTRALAHQLAPRKITVNAVCPGWVRTEMAAGRMGEIGITEENLATSVPLQRFIEPAEIADFIYYLASSPGAAMITGQALTVDGGTLP
jgi:NAD(P)-dependent dehydrogenase (short-subunit alcohol dehydrogenase family)